ncbi:N-alpha-acetyltransferase 35, NatC auxiliary subunit-like [Rhopilema esculentum]|uniref:N-alpha-acetyltransferase 35, NatC auxiliary subunit-like n=1 Tax=Rhopilema esculentum TaxID=499914 RepID=UPI0031D639BA|eukprot:gene7616-13428_t
MVSLLRPQIEYNWQDITSEFKDACGVLKVDELVHDDMFGLFEAMSAIEIMDPKMDAGMVCKNTPRNIMQFKDAVSCGNLKVSGFQPNELLGIIDELLACFVTWLDGHSLIQTVFICLYTHDTNLIEDPVLRAICISVLKMVDVVRNIVGRAKVYEEEDFQTLSYGFKLGLDVTELRISGMLREAEEEISRQIKAQLIDMKPEDKSVDALKGIKLRLKIWRAFYCALITFEKPDVAEVNKAKEWLGSALKLIPEAIESLHLGLQLEKREGSSSETSMLGFDSLVNHRLLPPSFPREINVVGRKQAYDYAKELIHSLLHVANILGRTNYHSVLEFVSDFSRQSPCVLSRSVLQLLVYHNGRVFGKLQMSEMLRDTIKNFNCSPVLADMSPLNSSQEAKDIATMFVGKASMVMLSLLHGHGHNRARQRERLADTLEELGNLQEEADKADSALNQILLGIDNKRQHLACFGSWVLYHTLKVMIEYILLGFELELFNPHEFHYVYWYLDFLAGWGINCLSRAEKLVVAQEQYIDKKCGKKDKKRKKELITVCQESIKDHQHMKSFFMGIKFLCLGIVKACEGFEKDKKIKRPQAELDNEQVRFEHRFSAFMCIDTPQPVTYFQYKDATSSLFSSENTTPALYQEAQKYFERAVSTFQRFNEKSRETESLLKVAKTNFVVMKLACSGHKKESNQLVEWDFTASSSFPVIKLL